jgi:hypothetical protein
VTICTSRDRRADGKGEKTKRRPAEKDEKETLVEEEGGDEEK